MRPLNGMRGGHAYRRLKRRRGLLYRRRARQPAFLAE